MAVAAARPLYFDFHGVVVQVEADDDDCRSRIENDFSLFRVPAAEPAGKIHVCISAWRCEPPYSRVPRNTWWRLRTKDARVYTKGKVRYLDSEGRALVVIDFESDSSEIYSSDLDLLHEKSYLMIMSRVGHWLDRRGLHRLHAMGMAFRGRSILCLLPKGGGKTTLALELLGRPEFLLLSDEAPLVDRNGRIHALPIRLGVEEGSGPDVAEPFLSVFRRSRYAPKTLIDARCFADRSAAVGEPGIVFVGRRAAAASPRIGRIGRVSASRALWEMGVRGRGVPQLLEYVLRVDPKALFERLGIMCSRILACYTLLRQSDCFELELSSDRTANARLIAGFVAERFEGRSPVSVP